MSSGHSDSEKEKEYPGSHLAARRHILNAIGMALFVVLSSTLSSQDGKAYAQVSSAPLESEHAPEQTQLLSGTVTDPSGALIADATVFLIADGAGPGIAAENTTRTSSTGRYRLWAKSGNYILTVKALGFAKFESPRIYLAVEGGQTRPRRRVFDVRLGLETDVQQISVSGDASDAVTHGGTAVVLSARDIETMPLDTAALLDELQGMAGSKDAELYVDGFSGAKLPPRASIREIRINQNPFSAQNDTNPVNGVIQVSTKPGTDQRHGEFYLYGDDSVLNAKNPFTPRQPGYYAFASGANLSGPLHRRASYNIAFDQSTNQTNSAVVAQVLDSNLNAVGFNEAVPNPLSTLSISSRIDLQASQHSTLSFRYVFARTDQTNAGVGQLVLSSEGHNSSVLSDTVQISNAQVIGSRMVNDTRFQYLRLRTSQTPTSMTPALIVQGAFNGGGDDSGRFSDHLDRYELQNYASLVAGAHYLNMGARLRVARDANRSQENYNGEFIFSTLSAYQLTLVGIAKGLSAAQISISGGGASQFNLTTGNPDAEVSIADAGIFAQDDWKVRPNLTLSYGLRFETQTYIADHADWAPRFGFSWGFNQKGKNGAPKYVLHGGAGIFYRRFTTDSALRVERQNGTTQQEYIVLSPNFYPAVPAAASLGSQAAETTYRVSPSFHAPYYLGVSIGLDRQLGRRGTATITYLNNRGVHTQFAENINAPLPGTYSTANPSSGVRPYGNQNIYEFVSEGVYRSSRLTANLTLRAGSRFTAYGYYMLRFDKNDADSSDGFPSNQYDVGTDYSRSLGDVRHAATIGGNANLAHGFHGSGYLRAQSGAPFNIVLGQDLNGDTQYNDRPTFATDVTRTSVVSTKWGVFDTDPIAGQTIIPRNYGTGPGFFLVNLAIGKSFGVGPTPKTAPAPKGSIARKYTLDFWAESQNLLNHPNLGSPVGILTPPSFNSTISGSSLFGRSISVTGASALSADRIVDLQMSLRF